MANGSEESPSPSQASPKRGKYLATAVALCAFCHSEIDWKSEGFPPKEGTVGGGRAPFNEGMPWLTSPNISPDKETGAGNWSDLQFEQALRRGIGHDGRTLYPAMPYHDYHGMSDDDATSIVMFLRSIPAVKHQLPPTKIPEEAKASLAPLPAAGAVKAPEMSQTAQYGGYLAKIALCDRCHTPRDESGKPVETMAFAGGIRLKGPWGDVTSLNITPDATGLDDTSEKIFMAAVKTGHLPGGVRLNAIMPWGYFHNMSDADVRAIFAFLKSQKPIEHHIDNSSPATPCKKCGGTHGQGNKNG
jgi:cytochrome c553